MRSDLVQAACKWAIACCIALAVFRIWCCLCFFVAQEWNDVRLRPTFLITDGLPLFAGLDAGPITTWALYGPVLPLLMLPATLASTIDSALAIAGAWNALLQAGAIAFACLLWPSPADRSWNLESRLGALAVSLLLLPQAFLQFLHADNAVLACGLVSLTCLARAPLRENWHWWWLAAGFAGAAAFSKLQGGALIVGEIGWVWFAVSRPQALRQGLRLVLVCAVGVLVTLWVCSSPTAAWDMVVAIPSRLPFTVAWRERLVALAPHYALMVVLPGIFALHAAWHHRLRSSGLGLPVCVWVVSLPLALAGTLGTGGAHNSLHGAFFLIPVALADLFAHSLKTPPRTRFLSPGVSLAGLVVLLAWQGMDTSRLPRRPLVALPLEAVAFSTRLGQRVWLPWRPLATRFATGRHDHDEDGLYVRQVIGLYPRREHVLAYLPPQWDSTLLQAYAMNWGVATAMHDHKFTTHLLGHWVLLRQTTPDPAAGQVPAKVPAKP